ncbi:protein kinase domain-containing protein, partial [Haematococcus lacustris]
MEPTHLPPKSVSAISIDNPPSSQLWPRQTGSETQIAAYKQPARRSVAKQISTLFKGLFKSKASGDGMETRALSALAPGEQRTGHWAGEPISVVPSGSSVKGTHASSTAALEIEVAAAMKRAASITGRQAAPSTLLVMAADVPRSMVRQSWNLRDYTILEKLYTGYASNVYKAVCKFSGETTLLVRHLALLRHACGHMKRPSLITPSMCMLHVMLLPGCALCRMEIFREVKLHSGLSHEHIIRLFGAFQQADQVVLVQEFADAGDLFSLLHKYGGKLPERNAVELVLHPFLLVLNYLHSNENILFTADMRLKLCDFGLAINMREERAVLNCPFKQKPDENKENSALHYSFHADTVRQHLPYQSKGQNQHGETAAAAALTALGQTPTLLRPQPSACGLALTLQGQKQVPPAAAPQRPAGGEDEGDGQHKSWWSPAVGCGSAIPVQARSDYTPAGPPTTHQQLTRPTHNILRWAVGVLSYELLVGLPPFSDNNRSTVEAKIRLQTPRFPSKMSELARNFISQALEKDPLERPSVHDMLHHKWIKTYRRSSSVRQLPGRHANSGGGSKAGSSISSQCIPEQDDPGSSATSPTTSPVVTWSPDPQPDSPSTPPTPPVSHHKAVTSTKSFTAGALPRGAHRPSSLATALAANHAA